MKEWTYKGCVCQIEYEFEDDCIKAWHYVKKPDGTVIFAPLSPYVEEKALEAWIDANFPKHPRNGNSPCIL